MHARSAMQQLPIPFAIIVDPSQRLPPITHYPVITSYLTRAKSSCDRGSSILLHTNALSNTDVAASGVLYSKAPITPATAASRPPALIARLAAELADELEELELLELLAVPVLLDSESVAVAVAEPVEEDRAALPVAEAVLVEAYWLARAQNWVTWP